MEATTIELDQHISEIRTLFEQGKSVKEVATSVGAGVNELKKFIMDSSLESMVKNKSYWPWNEAEDDQLRNEVQQGMSFKDIASSHGRSVGAVNTRTKSLGIGETTESNAKGTRRAWTKAELDRIKDLHLQGLNFTQIGKELNRSPNSVSAKFKKLQKQQDQGNWSCPKCSDSRIAVVFQCGHGHCHPCSVQQPECGVCQAPVQLRIALAF